MEMAWLGHEREGRKVGVSQDCHGKRCRDFCLSFPRHLQIPDRVLGQDKQDGIRYDIEDAGGPVDGKAIDAVARYGRIP